MHRLQQYILITLIHRDHCRYTELKPVEVEGNLFMYHLRSLMKAGYIIKRPDGRYALSPEGQRYADGYSLEQQAPRAQPHIVTLVACDNDDGQWLLLRRQRQPLLHMVGFPYGKLHLGEMVAEAAARELTEKTGLTAVLSHRGDGYITINQGDDPVSQIMFHLFYGHNPAGTLRPESRAGTAFWAYPDSRDAAVMPSVFDLIAQLQATSGHFFFEQSYNLAAAEAKGGDSLKPSQKHGTI